MPIAELASFDAASGVCWVRWRFELGPDMVWEALTDPIWVRRWLGNPVGTWASKVGDAVEIDHAGERQRSVVRACSPARRLEVSWEFPDEPTSVVDAHLAPTASGCDLTLTHTGLGELARDYALGWHAHLVYLAAALRAAPLPLDKFDEVLARVTRAYR